MAQSIQEEIDDSIIDTLYNTGEKFSGDCHLILHVLNNKGKSEIIKSPHLFISNSNDCLEYLKNIVGYKNVWLS